MGENNKRIYSHALGGNEKRVAWWEAANNELVVASEWYSQDTEPKKPTCYECMVQPPDEEKLRQLRLLNVPPKTLRRRKKKRRNKNRRGGNVIDNNGSHLKNNNCHGTGAE
uniref:Uncharacterized protein n=1 Tax=Romanomermis culicivorax TaxID=13658 RepID=A0A915KSZ7_ROMCU